MTIYHNSPKRESVRAHALTGLHDCDETLRDDDLKVEKAATAESSMKKHSSSDLQSLPRFVEPRWYPSQWHSLNL